MHRHEYREYNKEEFRTTKLKKVTNQPMISPPRPQATFLHCQFVHGNF